MDLDKFLSTYAGYASKEELLEKNLEENTKSANYSLIMQAIAEQAGISVTTDDVAAFFTKYYKTDDYSEYKTTFGMPFLMQAALYQKVLDNLRSTAILA